MSAATTPFDPTRDAALARLADFAPSAGRDYATNRNTDAGPGAPSAVSRLSPYLRYRLLTEHEVVATVLERHGLAGSEKFVQEVLWRTYWKGWLEMRPSVWTRFLDARDRERQDFSDQGALAAAESGTTGIDGFDDWARELVATGYLHNHARMWFASIWIFTLRLPWSLGADFFLRHLLDADAASNTLSWRWVAGLQTVGKHYVATADNIARYTNGRYRPTGLAIDAVPLTEAPVESARPLVEPRRPIASERSLLLVTSDDLNPESLFTDSPPLGAALVAVDDRLLWGEGARAFVHAASRDATGRVEASFGVPVESVGSLDAQVLLGAARTAGASQIVTAFAPVGPVADRLRELGPVLEKEGVVLAQSRRSWDEQAWPFAKKGYFAFKERIPELLRASGLR